MTQATAAVVRRQITVEAPDLIGRDQILRDPHRQPEGEDSTTFRPPSDLGQQSEQRTRRRIPAVHRRLRPSASYVSSYHDIPGSPPMHHTTG